MKLVALDLFSGCGGLSIGLEQAGIDILWANEIDKDASKTYTNYLKNTKMFAEDVELFFKRILNCEKGCPQPKQLDLVVGGPPCQGFSSYNRHRHPSDPRNSLVGNFLHFIEYLKPRYVLMENVPGILSIEKGGLIEYTEKWFHKISYKISLHILQAGYYGLPQNRWRVFMIAAKNNEKMPPPPEPTYKFPRIGVFGAKHFQKNIIKPFSEEPDLFYKPKEQITVEDAISDLPEIENGYNVSEMNYVNGSKSAYQKSLRKDSNILFDHVTSKLSNIQMQRCKHIPKTPGSGWLDLPDELKPNNLKRHGDRRYQNRFGRLHWKGYFNTILSRPHPYWSAVFHPDQDRVISVRESARAQGFPDKVRFFGGLSSKYRQVGNAVPPPLGKLLGEKIAEVAL